jgi:hypothetical protein
MTRATYPRWDELVALVNAMGHLARGLKHANDCPGPCMGGSGTYFRDDGYGRIDADADCYTCGCTGKRTYTPGPVTRSPARLAGRKV